MRGMDRGRKSARYLNTNPYHKVRVGALVPRMLDFTQGSIVHYVASQKMPMLAGFNQ